MHSRYELLGRLLVLLNIMALVFESFIFDRFRFYVVLLPSMIISLFLIWYSFYTIKYFSNWIDSAYMIKDIIIWNLSFYGICIDVITLNSDISFLVCVLASILAMTAFFFLKREHSLVHEIRLDHNQHN